MHQWNFTHFCSSFRVPVVPASHSSFFSGKLVSTISLTLLLFSTPRRSTTPEFRFCCLHHHATQCLPVTDDFSSCEDLMSDVVLRLFVWVVGFVALIGNTFVIIWRLMYPSGNKKVDGDFEL